VINWNTETNTMNLLTEAPVLSSCLVVGAVLVVMLLVTLEKRKP
jgi:hypothetical protein